jgi:hypothetical protein
MVPVQTNRKTMDEKIVNFMSSLVIWLKVSLFGVQKDRRKGTGRRWGESVKERLSKAYRMVKSAKPHFFRIFAPSKTSIV